MRVAQVPLVATSPAPAVSLSTEGIGLIVRRISSNALAKSRGPRDEYLAAKRRELWVGTTKTRCSMRR